MRSSGVSARVRAAMSGRGVAVGRRGWARERRHQRTESRHRPRILALPIVEGPVGTDGVAQQGSGIRNRRPQEGHRTDRFRAPCGTLGIGGEALGRSEPALRHGDARCGRRPPRSTRPTSRARGCDGRRVRRPPPRGRAAAAPQDQRQSTQSEPLDQRVVDTTGVFLAPGEVIGRRIELERAVALQTRRELDPRQDRRVVDLARDVLCGGGVGGRLVELHPLEGQLRQPDVDLRADRGLSFLGRVEIVAEWDRVRTHRVHLDSRSDQCRLAPEAKVAHATSQRDGTISVRGRARADRCSGTPRSPARRSSSAALGVVERVGSQRGFEIPRRVVPHAERERFVGRDPGGARQHDRVAVRARTVHLLGDLRDRDRVSGSHRHEAARDLGVHPLAPTAGEATNHRAPASAVDEVDACAVVFEESPVGGFVER